MSGLISAMPCFPTPQRTPKNKPMLFLVCLYIFEREQATSISNLMGCFTPALFCFYLLFCSSHRWAGLYGDAEVAEGRLLLKEFVPWSCQHRCRAMAKACWRQISHTAGCLSQSFCSYMCLWLKLTFSENPEKPTQFLATQKLHQVKSAYLAIHIIVSEVTMSYILGQRLSQSPASAETSRGAVFL